MRIAYQWHGRLGWLLAPLLALQALSGAALLWMRPLQVVRIDAPAVEAWAGALDLGLAELARRAPAAKVAYVNLPHQAGAPLQVRLVAMPSSQGGWLDIDAVSGALGTWAPDSGQLRALLFGLHQSLLLSEPGAWLLRALALSTLVLLAMGLRVWWRVRRLPARTPWRSLHRGIGPVLALPLVVILATGAILRSPDWTRAALSAWTNRPATALPSAGPASHEGTTVTLGQALRAARAELPLARPTRIYAARGGETRVRMSLDEWHPLGLSSVYVSSTDAAVRRVVRAADQGLSERYLNLVYPLHIGALPAGSGTGAALMARGLWTLLALLLVGLAVSGAVQRIQARSKRRPTATGALKCKQAQGR